MAKILHFKAKNFKHIKEVEIFPGDDSMIVVGGLNAAGKTSCIDGIKATLGGKRLIDKMPVRAGEETGFTEVLLDEDGTLDPVPIVVRRHWEEFGKKTWLTITTKDGYEAPSPQSILDRFFSAVTFDPLAFSRMPPEAQAASLKELVGLDIEELEEEEKALYEERTSINRQGLELKARLKALPEPHTDVDGKPRDMVSIGAELASATTHNRSYENTKDRANKAKRVLEERKAALDAAQAAHDVARLDAIEAILKLDQHHDPVDTMSIIQKMSCVELHNKKLRENEARQNMEVELDSLREESKMLTDKLKKISHQKSAALKDVKWPMEGLSVDGEQVLYHGVPLQQVSSSEGLDIAVAIGIAMNPSLKVLLIKDGALIGDEKLAIIKKRAEETGHQIWVEDVCRNKDDTNRCTVIIEDGQVVESIGS